MSLYKGSTLIAGGRQCMPLLSFMWADHELNDISWLRADTFSWQSGTVYTAVYGHLTDDITGKSLQSETISGTTVQFYIADDGHKICPASEESNVAAIYSATGVAWYYILDTVNQRFKLPRTKFGVTGLRDTVGKYIEAGLPNIVGSGDVLGQNDFLLKTGNYSGCIQKKGTASDVSQAGNSARSTFNHGFSIDASLSSSIYGNSTTVQPKATQMYLYFFVGSFTQTALENTAGLNASLFNGKADVDLTNAVSNASVTAKATIVGWGTPDYSSGVAFSNNTDYTAPSDGFVIASGWTNTSTNSYFNLNGTRMASFVANTSAWLPAMVYCPVHKGDIIRINFTQGTYTMNFYPLKGV